MKKKDYIQNPKENGYRSLHLIVEIPIFLSDEKKWVKVEVQFRTIAMDFWASLEHKIRYKKNLSKERLDEIDKELLECAKICKTLDEKMEEIKREIDFPSNFFRMLLQKKLLHLVHFLFHEFTILIESYCQQWDDDDGDT